MNEISGLLKSTFENAFDYAIKESQKEDRRNERKHIVRAYGVKEKPFKGTCRNDLCPCGSNKKYKNCCGR